MFELFNNIWVLLICLFLIYCIYKKILNLNKPIGETKFIEQMKNQQKLKKKINLNQIVTKLPDLASYYVGI